MDELEVCRIVYSRALDDEELARQSFGYNSPQRIAATIVRESAERGYFQEIDRPIGMEIARRRNRR